MNGAQREEIGGGERGCEVLRVAAPAAARPGLGADLEQIHRAVASILEPGSIAELRILGRGGVASGYFDDRAALVREAAR